MSDLFHNLTWFIPISVFVAGLIGSPHCMAMCGPIVMNFANRKTCLAGYQTGRMISYTLAGAIVGGLGQTVLNADDVPWLSKLSLVSVSILLIFNGYRAFSGKPIHLPLPKALTKFASSIWRVSRISHLPQPIAATLAGLFTVLLPCGHLYGFLLGAVATGSSMKGALFMFAFWLGSAPLLSLSGAWVQKLIRSSSQKRQRWAGALLILAGLFSISTFGARIQTSKAHAQGEPQKTEQTHRPHCH